MEISFMTEHWNWGWGWCNNFGNTGYPSGEGRQNRFLSHTVDKNQFQGNSRPKSETQNLKPSKGNIAENLYVMTSEKEFVKASKNHKGKDC